MATSKPEPRSGGGRRRKAPLSVNVDANTLERLRDAAVHYRVTLAELAEEAIRRELARRERKDGKIPVRTQPPKTGRPIGRE